MTGKRKKREATSRELIHILVDAVLDVHEQTEHFAAVQITNYGHDISIYSNIGGFPGKLQEFDFGDGFQKDDLTAIKAGIKHFRDLLEMKSSSDAANIQGTNITNK